MFIGKPHGERDAGVSRLTLPSIGLIGAIAIVAFGGASSAWGESAYDRYYKAIRSKPGITPGEAQELDKQILEPERQSRYHAFAQSMKEYGKGLAEKMRSEILKVWGPLIDRSNKPIEATFQGKTYKMDPATSRLKHPSSQGPSASGTGDGKGAPVTTLPPSPAPSRPQEVLDGSKVPKELEFQGKSSRGKKSSAAPSAAPSPVPTVLMDSSQIPPSSAPQEIEFVPRPKPRAPEKRGLEKTGRNR